VSDTTSRKKTLVLCIMKSVKSKIWETAVFLLLMKEIYEVSPLAGLRWHDISTKFHEVWLGHSGNMKVITSTT
jgi:hypothetical protein